MLICPKANPYDGLLDVTIIHPVGRLKLLRLFPRCIREGSFEIPASSSCEFARSDSRGPGLVGFGDGEMIAAAPLKVCCVPRALPVLTPWSALLRPKA